MDGLVTGQQVGLFVAYYILGFLLIASLMVAVGSACNTLKEAQNLMAPLSMLLALPLLLSILVLPLYIPTLIFGARAVTAAAEGSDPWSAFLMLAG